MVNNWRLTSALFCSIAFLSACGGGGGGGGDNPSRSGGPGGGADGGGEHIPDMQTGIFSDGPVAGLKYIQGSNAGFTGADGSFSYDANSQEPVQFFLGKVFLGQAIGGAIVTPFDLAAPGVPANLNTGYNVSRLLVSLDQNPADGIQLHRDINYAQGAVDFSVSTGVFELDEDIADIVARFGADDSLATMTQVQQHLAANAEAQQSMSDMTAQLDAITGVDVRWNPNLRQKGVLAEIRGSNGEALYLETDSSGSGSTFQHWLSNIFYNDGNGRYVAITLNSDGRPGVVNRSGTLYRYISGDTFAERDFASIDLYRPRQQAMLVARTGATPIPAGAISPERLALIQQAMESLRAGTLSDSEFLALVSASLSIAGNVLCAGSEAACAQRGGMTRYLELAADDEALLSHVDFSHEALTPAICTNIALTTTSERSCSNRNTLHELNVMFARERNDFSALQLLAARRQTLRIRLNDFSWPEGGGQYPVLSEEKSAIIMNLEFLIETYRLDDKRILVRTGPIKPADGWSSYLTFHFDGLPSDEESMPAGLLGAVDEARVFADKFVGDKIFVMTKIDDFFAADPMIFDYTQGVYVDLNNPPYDRLDIVTTDMVSLEPMEYDIDSPRSAFYIRAEVPEYYTGKLTGRKYLKFGLLWPDAYLTFAPLFDFDQSFNIRIPGCGECAISIFN